MNPTAYPHIQRRERLFNLATMRAASTEISPLEAPDAPEPTRAAVEPRPGASESNLPVSPAP